MDPTQSAASYRWRRGTTRSVISAGFDDELRGLSGGNALTIDPRYSFDLTARAGYLVNDKTLVYLRGGYANPAFSNGSIAGALLNLAAYGVLAALCRLLVGYSRHGVCGLCNA